MRSNKILFLSLLLASLIIVAAIGVKFLLLNNELKPVGDVFVPLELKPIDSTKAEQFKFDITKTTGKDYLPTTKDVKVEGQTFMLTNYFTQEDYHNPDDEFLEKIGEHQCADGHILPATESYIVKLSGKNVCDDQGCLFAIMTKREKNGYEPVMIIHADKIEISRTESTTPDLLVYYRNVPKPIRMRWVEDAPYPSFQTVNSQ